VLRPGVYAVLGLRLARGVYLDYTTRFRFRFQSAMWARSRYRRPIPAGSRHPLILLLRPLAWPFLAAGLDAKQASVLVMACFGGGTVPICFLFLRAIRAKAARGGALTCCSR